MHRKLYQQYGIGQKRNNERYGFSVVFFFLIFHDRSFQNGSHLIHEFPCRIVLFNAGGGTGVVQWLRTRRVYEPGHKINYKIAGIEKKYTRRFTV